MLCGKILVATYEKPLITSNTAERLMKLSKSMSLSKRIKTFLQACLRRFRQGTKQQPVALLPARKPLFADLRPGRQHCEIHDPDYLQQILMAEQNSSNPTGPTSPIEFASNAPAQGPQPTIGET